MPEYVGRYLLTLLPPFFGVLAGLIIKYIVDGAKGRCGDGKTRYKVWEFEQNPEYVEQESLVPINWFQQEARRNLLEIDRLPGDGMAEYIQVGPAVCTTAIALDLSMRLPQVRVGITPELFVLAIMGHILLLLTAIGLAVQNQNGRPNVEDPKRGTRAWAAILLGLVAVITAVPFPTVS